MKFRKAHAIFVLLLFTFFNGIQNTLAQPKQEFRKVTLFENIILQGSANTFVYINQDKTPGIKIKADQSYLGKIKTTVSEYTLTIILETAVVDDEKIEIYVNLPVVKKISILGGGNIELIEGTDNTLLQTSVKGGGKILITESVSVHKFQSQIEGGGSINALNLNIRDARIQVRDGGEVMVQVENRLDGRINGGGSILYTGSPELISNVAGGGSISRK